MKERGSLHSQDSWMVDINRQINAIIPINMVLIAFFEMSFKTQDHLCYTFLYLQTQVNVTREMEDSSRKPFRSL